MDDGYYQAGGYSYDSTSTSDNEGADKKWAASVVYDNQTREPQAQVWP